jgi:hypothetical protein
VWEGYFEDIRLDPENANRDQLSPLETARYILQTAAIARSHPERSVAESKDCAEAISELELGDCFAEFTLSGANVLAMTLWVLSV